MKQRKNREKDKNEQTNDKKRTIDTAANLSKNIGNRKPVISPILMTSYLQSLIYIGCTRIYSGNDLKISHNVLL